MGNSIIKKIVYEFFRIAKELRGLPREYKLAKYKKLLPNISPGMTSWSDSETGYLAICKLAAENDIIFKIFKRSKDYRRILEHVSKQQGQEYLNIIRRNGNDLLKYSHKFKENDKFGSPRTFNYNIGRFSPTTLRYIKVLMDLKISFGNLDNLDIVEIGAGYGGQCKIISSILTPSSYTIIDIEPVLSLIKKYLSKFNVENVIYYTPQQVDSKRGYDLIISNYAFSECTRRSQEDYIKKILYRAKRGYLTCNYNGVSFPTSPYNKDELFQILSRWHRIEIIDEEPRTGPFNFIIKWDDEKINKCGSDLTAKGPAAKPEGEIVKIIGNGDEELVGDSQVKRPNFTYYAKNAKEERRYITIEASDEADALKKLRKQGLTPIFLQM